MSVIAVCEFGDGIQAVAWDYCKMTPAAIKQLQGYERHGHNVGQKAAA
jgi:hypothetical protein